MSAKVYFKNLHGFRFLAALMVIITHIELFKVRVHIPNVWRNPFVFEAGSAGVDFFFALSGFLITALLLKEKEYTGKINIPNFYVRRILRIWPLYFLILLLCYFIVPQLPIFEIASYSEKMEQGFWSKLCWSILFMPNVALAIFKEIPYAAPIWSVGVEEQFYLFWPILLFAFRNTYRTIAFFIIGFISIKVLFILVNKVVPLPYETFRIIKEILVSTRMECMGIGALGAYIYLKKPGLLKLLNSNVLSIIAIFLIPVTFYFANSLFELHHILLSVFFLVIILNGATNSETWINLEGRVFYFLGNISYGLYLWHSLCVGIVINILRKQTFLMQNLFLFNVLLYVGAILFTVIISGVSYYYYERIFLRKKTNYSVIISGEEAKALQSN